MRPNMAFRANTCKLPLTEFNPHVGEGKKNFRRTADLFTDTAAFLISTDLRGIVGYPEGKLVHNNHLKQGNSKWPQYR